MVFHPKTKTYVKNTGIILAIISALATGAQQYMKLEEAKIVIHNEKTRQDQFEIFYSNEQDKLNCTLDSLKVKHKCH